MRMCSTFTQKICETCHFALLKEKKGEARMTPPPMMAAQYSAAVSLMIRSISSG